MLNVMKYTSAHDHLVVREITKPNEDMSYISFIIFIHELLNKF